ncbi:hypothetical protein NDU88_008826 [Pleurodeles waltl]|uniref:Uncharacterized protein n=1 Tax=Pleurodeles waltl TaxID=8319 RepID=A0AAV7P1E2_PLEWA|nr:hypothetical protein NDU88_008826 [Pleurodeles waltl]
MQCSHRRAWAAGHTPRGGSEALHKHPGAGSHALQDDCTEPVLLRPAAFCGYTTARGGPTRVQQSYLFIAPRNGRHRESERK